MQSENSTYCVDGFIFDKIEFFWAQLIITHVLIIFIAQIITILKKVLPLLTLNWIFEVLNNLIRKTFQLRDYHHILTKLEVPSSKTDSEQRKLLNSTRPVLRIRPVQTLEDSLVQPMTEYQLESPSKLS